MTAQRVRMDVIAQNIANAQTTSTPEGGPYRRRVVQLAPQPDAAAVRFGEHLHRTLLSVSDERHFREGLDVTDLAPIGGGVRVVGIVEDLSEGPIVYDPGHPDADADGYVRLPNVDVTSEMVDFMIARRVYEANASVFEAAKGVLRRSIEL